MIRYPLHVEEEISVIETEKAIVVQRLCLEYSLAVTLEIEGDRRILSIKPEIAASEETLVIGHEPRSIPRKKGWKKKDAEGGI